MYLFITTMFSCILWYIATMTVLYLGYLLILATIIYAETCKNNKECDSCIRGGCAWCADAYFQGTSRCFDREDTTVTCINKQDPNVYVTTTKDSTFSSSGTIIQIKPQGYKLSLRPNEEVVFEFKFKPAVDYPVDIYFLIDTSVSMQAFINHTAQNVMNFYSTMKSFTQDVNLGLGTFVDKCITPIKSNESDGDKPINSFEHILSLCKDVERLKREMIALKTVKNYDEPEGGLDGVAQALVCPELIGWRRQSRRIIIYMSDAPYHSAGDGRIAGIFKPYDGKCYTDNKTKVYIKQTEMDYPSVGIINYFAKKTETTIVFCTTPSNLNTYKRIIKSIAGSKQVNYNKKDNINDKLKTIYEEISQNIKIKTSTESMEKLKNFEIKFNPDCYSKKSFRSDHRNNNKRECKVGPNNSEGVTIVGSVKLKNYYGEDNIKIDVLIEGYDKEKLTLDIKVLKCDCPVIPKACSGKDPQRCGVCECRDNRYGDQCQCSKSEDYATGKNATCIAEGFTELCSGHGYCRCGVCECFQKSIYEGKFCECTKGACPNGCSGHGECQTCRKCKCEPGWSGDDCGCSDSTTTCIKNGKICNNRTGCQCNACHCPPLEDWDSRALQDDQCTPIPCPTCHTSQCRLLEPCVTCQTSHPGNCNHSCPQRIILENDTDDIHGKSECTINISLGCYSKFYYAYDEDNYGIYLFVTGEKNCVESNYVISAITVATLILVGLATLVVWKCLVNVIDRREYDRFVENHKAQLDQYECNVLYKAPEACYSNPAYVKSI